MPRSGRLLPINAAPTVPASGIAQVAQPKEVAATASEAAAPTGPATA